MTQLHQLGTGQTYFEYRMAATRTPPSSEEADDARELAESEEDCLRDATATHMRTMLSLARDWTRTTDEDWYHPAHGLQHHTIATQLMAAEATAGEARWHAALVAAVEDANR